MIKFFGKIRQKMLAENKFSKYLIYAIGEILLVVMGILIALQINIWNENRKNLAKEINYLSRLYNELDKNRSYAVLYEDFSNQQVESSEFLSKALLLENDNIEISELLNALIQGFQIPYPNYSDNVWQELKSTGDLSLLHNKDLSFKQSDYFNHIDQVIELEKEWAAFHLLYREMTNEILDFNNRKMIIDNTLAMRSQEVTVSFGKIVFDETNHNDLQVKYIMASLHNIKGLSGVLSDININKTVAAIIHGKIEMDSMEMQRLIADEINSLSN